MANSITASTNSPYTLPLLQDVNFNVSASFPTPTLLGSVTGNTTSIFFPNLQYPTMGKFVIQPSISAITGLGGGLSVSCSLQDSSDNVNWNNIAIFANPLFTSNGTGSVILPLIILGPLAKPYLRAQVTVPASASASGAALTGTYGFNTQF